jgi:hypothetical protein
MTMLHPFSAFVLCELMCVLAHAHVPCCELSAAAGRIKIFYNAPSSLPGSFSSVEHVSMFARKIKRRFDLHADRNKRKTVTWREF